MMWIFALLFFIFTGILIFILIRFLDEKNLERFADEVVKRKQNEYKKPKKEDITDL